MKFSVVTCSGSSRRRDYYDRGYDRGYDDRDYYSRSYRWGNGCSAELLHLHSASACHDISVLILIVGSWYKNGWSLQMRLFRYEKCFVLFNLSVVYSALLFLIYGKQSTVLCTHIFFKCCFFPFPSLKWWEYRCWSDTWVCILMPNLN